MNIFNSLGSNYTFKEALKILFIPNLPDYKTNLVKTLEEKYSGKAHLTYKGREALSLALSLIDTRRKKVAITGFTCYAVYEPIERAGFNAVLIDIDKETLNFSPESLENLAKRENLAAVVIQNTLGFPCDISKIQKICKEYKIILIEDLAHSVGAVYENGKEAGTVGDIVVLSFSQDKMIDAVSGGAIIIRNKDLIKDMFIKKNQTEKLRDRIYPFLSVSIRILYPYLIGKVFHFILKKLNVLSAPMDGYVIPTTPLLWQCHLAQIEFDSLNKNIAHRRLIANIYFKNISESLLNINLKKKNNSSYLRFPIFVKNRKGLIEFLKKEGIYVSDIWYDAPIAPHRFLSQTGYGGECPNAEMISQTILNLPTHKNVSKAEAEKLSEIINQWEKLQ